MKKKKIKKLIKKGLSNKEVYEIMGIKRSRQISRMMTNTRVKLKRGKKKVQRPSNAQLPERYNDDEEYFLYEWELEASRVPPEANAGSV